MKKSVYTKLLVILVIMISVGIGFFLTPYIMKKQILPENKYETIALPAPSYESSTSVEEALLKRRSVREFDDEPLALSQVSQLLWAAQGTTDPSGKRTAPSAGALYPLEIYVVVGNVSGLSSGIYKYKPAKHELLKISDGDIRKQLSSASLGQASIKDGAITIVMAGVYERTTSKYGDRGIRYVHMEAGHAAQNIYLQAESLGLGTVVTGAFDDAHVERLLNLQKDEEPLYLIPVGKK